MIYKTLNRTTANLLIEIMVGTTVDLGFIMATEERRIAKKLKDEKKAQTHSGWNKPNIKHQNTGRRI